MNRCVCGNVSPYDQCDECVRRALCSPEISMMDISPDHYSGTLKVVLKGPTRKVVHIDPDMAEILIYQLRDSVASLHQSNENL